MHVSQSCRLTCTGSGHSIFMLDVTAVVSVAIFFFLQNGFDRSTLNNFFFIQSRPSPRLVDIPFCPAINPPVGMAEKRLMLFKVINAKANVIFTFVQARQTC